MKVFLHLRIMALVMAGMLAPCLRASAQSFGLSVTSSTNLIILNDSVTYTIGVTNPTSLTLTNVFVTNTLSAPFKLGVVFPSQDFITNSANVVLLSLSRITNGGLAQVAMNIQPTNTGFFTNTIVAVVAGTTNTASTNLVVQVITAQADLGVTIAGPIQAVVTNDWMTYGVTATNSGPDAAPNVVLTNALPPGVVLLNVSPSNQIYNVVTSNLIFNLGTMMNGGWTNLQFTIQPTNAGGMTLAASIGSPGLLDTNLANNSASTNISVIGYLPGTLVAVTNSAQIYNPQNGLIEQSILLANSGSTNVPAARVVVTGLTNQFVNAVGTNDGNPFVYYSTTLNTNQSVSLLLQYCVRTRSPFTFSNSQLHAFAVPVPNWTPPAITSARTNLNLTRIVGLPNGNMLIEWPAITNRTYTVVYSDNVLFSNAMMAPPSITALGTQLQWVDYGPPTTVRAPTNASSRFYRVFLNP